MGLQGLSHEQEEAKCRRCGIGCHMPIEVGDQLFVVEELHCKFLAREASGMYSCTVYEKRFEMAPWCHTAVEAVGRGQLAHDCPYAEGVENFKGRKWAPPDVRARALPLIREKMIADGLPASCDPEAALRAVNGAGGGWSYRPQNDRFVFFRNGDKPE